MRPGVLEQLLTLDDHVRPDERLCIGYSGGLDSTVLLHALAALQRWPLHACHVHHGLSPNAEHWAAHCARFAEGLGVELSVVRVEVPRTGGTGLEAAARMKRHQALAAAGGDWLVLAHHQGDQAETVLGNLLRGAGVLGLAGMPVRSGRILRPLLALSRAQLADYARVHGLSWIEDESNADLHYTRNWLRGQVIPVLRKRYGQAEERLAAAAAHAGEAQALLEQLAAIDAGGRPGFPLPLARLRALEFARASNLLRCALKAEGLQAPPASRLDEFVRQCREAASDRHPALHLAGCALRVRARQLWLERDR